MQLRIHPDIVSRFPNIAIGVLVVEGVSNPPSPESLKQLLLKQSEHIRTFYTIESLLADPRVARWREIYPQFGAKPRDYRSSIESMGRRCINGKGVPSISSLVNAYNVISLKYFLTAGGEDLDQIQGDIELAFATNQEPPTKLLGDEKEQSPFPGEVIYKDGHSAICRCWNWREADRTKLTEETQRCALVLEDVTTDTTILQQALEELMLLVQSTCGGRSRSFVLNNTHLSEELSV